MKTEHDLVRTNKQLEEAWKRATAAALAASEEEARRIGHELHDTLCQDLIGLSRQAEALTFRAAGDARPPDAAAGRLQQLAEMAAAAARRARDLSHLLALSEPADVPLEEALAGHLRQLERLYGITCDLSLGEMLPSVSHEQGMHLIRIVREAVVNAARHAGARHIWVDGLRQDSGMVISISSDGGPATSPEMWKEGLGLRQMRMRAALLGASLDIRPGDRSVVVQLMLPGGPSA
jgi:two-component system sensor histidine kinase UhpB